MHSASESIRQYRVWDRTTRAFHWINVICVLVLGALGTLLLNGKILGLSQDGSTLVKKLHAYVGYAFVLNLVWRFVWAFIGNRYARWGAMLPATRGTLEALRQQAQDILAGRPRAYVGHSPLGRLMIVSLLVLLLVQAMTGLMLAGTDLYWPPFGHYFANWVTDGDAQRLTLLSPGSTEHVVSQAYDAMKVFRRPFKETHEIVFYVLLAAIALHIAANVLEEIRSPTGQISAMFSGVKSLRGRPVDEGAE